MATQPLNTNDDAGLGLFEKWLSVWVSAAILLGLLIGNIAPDAVAILARLEYASVNLVVAVLIWAMIYPMMVGVDFASIKNIGKKPKGLFITIVVNWLIKPFTMAALGPRPHLSEVVVQRLSHHASAISSILRRV